MFNTSLPPEILNIIINQLPFGSKFSLLFTSKASNKLVSSKISDKILEFRERDYTVKDGLIYFYNDLVFLKVYYQYHKNTFDVACIIGILHQSPDLEVITWLCSLSIINIEIIDIYGSYEPFENPLLKDFMFYNSCKFNQIDLAKWLQSIGANMHGCVINCEDYDPFIISCQYGHFELFKWLYSLNPEHVTQNYDFFHIACKFGRLEIAQWLYTLDLQTNNPIKGVQWICLDYPLIKACKYGRLNVAKWLHSIGANIHAYDNNYDSVAQIATDNDQHHIVEWIKKLTH